MSGMPRADADRVLQECRRNYGWDIGTGTMPSNWRALVTAIFDEFNRVLDEYDKDPEDPQLLENAGVRLLERHQAALVAAAKET